MAKGIGLRKSQNPMWAMVAAVNAVRNEMAHNLSARSALRGFVDTLDVVINPTGSA
jgi:hypothetical protein